MTKKTTKELKASRKYNLKNKELINEKSRQYTKNNREKVRATKKRYRQKNKEKINAKRMERYLKLKNEREEKNKMVFGRKIKPVKEPEVALEVPIKEIKKIVTPKVIKKQIIEQPVEETIVEEQPVEETIVEEQPVEETIEKLPEIETKKTMQIISGELMENGLHRYIIISNAPIGKVGDIEELE